MAIKGILDNFVMGVTINALMKTTRDDPLRHMCHNLRRDLEDTVSEQVICDGQSTEAGVFDGDIPQLLRDRFCHHQMRDRGITCDHVTNRRGPYDECVTVTMSCRVKQI